MPHTGLQVRSLVNADQTLELSLVEAETPDPGPDEVVVRVEATPINPSDLALLFAFCDRASISTGGSAERPVVTATIPDQAMRLLAPRVGQSLAVGNEGAGTVVAAGDSPAAQALLGRVVGAAGGEMYSQYRCLPAASCLPLAEGTTPAQGASCFVNPLTALAMVETLRAENHKALVHTAAASNLGQMLNRICQADGIPLVNIVRKPEQAELLKGMGARYVVNSAGEAFLEELTEALVATGATLAFDAIGGGQLASQILTCMETAASRNSTGYNRYGSDVYKQLYIYGSLDFSPTILKRNFGFSWGIGGFLLTPFLARAGRDKVAQLQARVAREIDSTFASHYTAEVSLAGALSLDAMARYGRQATGEKYLIKPQD